MKNASQYLFVLFSLLSSFTFSQTPPEIQDPWTIGINKLPPRTAIWPSPDLNSARTATYDQAEWVRSLNGDWRFTWSPDPDSRPVGFYKKNYNRSGWKTIPVPSTMERQGYGTPLYVNIPYPFKVNPPRVMDEPDAKFTTFKSRNPVGSYSRTFTVPENWEDKQIILHFAGISSAAFVWVNGEKVGYTQGTRLPAEFDITPYITKGENLLAVEVYKYCDGSYLEDQDYWRLSGIYRDVFIRAVPKLTLWDVYARPEVDLHTRKGKVALHYRPTNFGKRKGKKYSVSVSIVSPEGEPLTEKRSVKIKPLKAGYGTEVVLPEIEVDKVQLWYDENPVQYAVEVSLEHKGVTVEAYRLPVAFRKIEVQGNRLVFNGSTLKIRGVNRHEFSPDQGWVVTREQMIEELKLMKRANINFVRTSHYPNDPRWYELCNEYGMMVMDEVNVETHELSYHKRVLPGDEPEWSFGCVNRMKRLVIRDRQYPCVVMWSLGNEAGFGDTFMEMRKTTLAHDPEKRLIQYADMNLAGDFDSQTYPPISWMKEHLLGKAKRKGERGQPTHEHQHGKYPSGRPFVMNEYSHAMGNSLGNFSDYWDFIYQHDLFAGGFIWDWIDQALWKNPADGGEGFVYGGDFGDFPNDDNFCVNGIIGADLQPHPHYEEMRKVYQPVYFKLVKKAPLILELTNHNQYFHADEYDFGYQLMEDGKITEEWELPPLSLGPQEKTEIDIDLPEYDKDKEVYIKFFLTLRKEVDWADKGYVVAWEQFKLSDGKPKPDRMALGIGQGILIRENTQKYLLTGAGFAAEIDKSTGLLSNLELNNKLVVDGNPRFNFWRTITDNDEGWKADRKLRVWKDEGRNYKLDDLQVENIGGKISFKSKYTFKETGTEATVKQTFYPNGNVEFDVDLNISEEMPNVPRIGMQFELNNNLRKVDWYGRGPHENYVDRKTSSAVGLYTSTVDDWVTPYVRPQENGNRCDVRWIAFSDKNRGGVQFSAGSEELLSVSAWPYTQEILANTAHDFELEKHDKITVNIDHKQMGVGGDNSWGLPVMEKYQVKPGSYRYRFVLQKK